MSHNLHHHIFKDLQSQNYMSGTNESQSSHYTTAYQSENVQLAGGKILHIAAFGKAVEKARKAKILQIEWTAKHSEKCDQCASPKFCITDPSTARCAPCRAKHAACSRSLAFIAEYVMPRFDINLAQFLELYSTYSNLDKTSYKQIKGSRALLNEHMKPVIDIERESSTEMDEIIGSDNEDYAARRHTGSLKWKVAEKDAELVRLKRDVAVYQEGAARVQAELEQLKIHHQVRAREEDCKRTQMFLKISVITQFLAVALEQMKTNWAATFDAVSASHSGLQKIVSSEFQNRLAFRNLDNVIGSYQRCTDLNGKVVQGLLPDATQSSKRRREEGNE